MLINGTFIKELNGQIVVKDGLSFLKWNSMLLEVGFSFALIPFKFNHMYIVCIERDLSRGVSAALSASSGVLEILCQSTNTHLQPSPPNFPSIRKIRITDNVHRILQNIIHHPQIWVQLIQVADSLASGIQLISLSAISTATPINGIDSAGIAAILLAVTRLVLLVRRVRKISAELTIYAGESVTYPPGIVGHSGEL